MYKNVITFTFSSASLSWKEPMLLIKFFTFIGSVQILHIFMLSFLVAGIEMYLIIVQFHFFSKCSFCFGSIPISYSVQVRTCVLVV